MTLAGTTKTLQVRTVTNGANQTAVWTAGQFNTGDAGRFRNRGTFTTDFDGNFSFNLGGTQSRFENQGTGSFTKTGGTGSTTVTAAFDNSGTAGSDIGALRLTGGGTSSGAWHGSARTDLGGGTHVLTGTQYAPAGILEVSGGTANFDAASGPVTGGNMEVSSSGTASWNTGQPVTFATLAQSGGTLSGADTVSVTGLMNWSGGAQEGTGETRAQGGMTLAGTTKTIVQRTVVNAAGQTATWTAGQFNTGTGGTFRNLGTLTTNFDGNFSDNLGGGQTTFDNQGNLTKTAGAGNSTFTAVVANSGTLTVQSGTLRPLSGLTQTAGLTLLVGGGLGASGDTLTFQGGTLRGIATVAGNVVNTGAQIEPGPGTGTLSLSNTFAQSGAGSLAIELGGTAAGQFDRLVLTSVGAIGAATLGGTLDVTLTNGFVPASGDSFVIMSYGSTTGAFATTNLPALGGGLSWNVAVGATSLTLTVVP
jgi:hypothetical protein